MKDVLVIFALFDLFLELYRFLRGYWIRRIPKIKKEAKLSPRRQLEMLIGIIHLKGS